MSAWANPDKGQSDQWFYYEWDVGESLGGSWVEFVPCLGEVVQVEGVFRLWVNVHTSPDGGYKTYTRHFVQEDGDIVATGLSSGRQYFVRGGMCWNESGRGSWEMFAPVSWVVDAVHLVFEAEDGERLVFHAVFLGTLEDVLVIKKFDTRWSCH